MHMRSAGKTVAVTTMAIDIHPCSVCINLEPLLAKGIDMLLELLEDGLFIVFVIGMLDGVIREYPSMMTFVSGLGILLGVLFIA